MTLTLNVSDAFLVQRRGSGLLRGVFSTALVSSSTSFEAVRELQLSGLRLSGTALPKRWSVIARGDGGILVWIAKRKN